jgi:manganese peroxidase
MARTLVGRKDSSAAGPGGMPSPFHNADKILQMFAEKGFSARETVALVGSHTTSKQFSTSPTDAGDAQDRT